MKKLPLGCTPVSGNTPGVSHPSPAKAKHFIYVSVAQSAPVMREYRNVPANAKTV